MAAPSKVPAQLSIAVVSLVVILADQSTKAWAVNALSDRTIDVVWKLQFHLTSNTGFAFSTGQGLGPFLGLVALLVVVVLWRMRDGFSGSVSVVALGLILGGATGNLLDRAFRGSGWGRGAVIDFIDFQFWPVFNVADAAIVVGVVALSLKMWTEQREVKRSA